MSFRTSFPDFRLRLTFWGGGFLVAALVLGAAAVNTGNNALMAALGLALGAYVVSGTWSRQVLARVEARVTAPRDLFAGRPTVVEVELFNRSRWFPAYGLLLRDAEDQPVLLERLLPTGSRRRYSVSRSFPRRGRVPLGPWRLEVLLPLGFFLKSKSLLAGQEVVVYPRLLDRSRLDVTGHGGGRVPHQLGGRGREGEVTRLREYRDGDERRQVHWKQSARQQRPIVVERQRASEAPVVMVLDPRVSDPHDPVILEQFEELVSEVATRVVERLGRGEPAGVVVGSTVAGPFSSPLQAPLLLRPLAEVEACGPDAVGPMEVAGSLRFSVQGAP
jgi:uncharacterized protein (DUF58 family)